MSLFTTTDHTGTAAGRRSLVAPAGFAAALWTACVAAALSTTGCGKSEAPSGAKSPAPTGGTTGTSSAPATGTPAAPAPSAPAPGTSAPAPASTGSTPTATGTPAPAPATGTASAQPAAATTPLPAGWYAVYSGPGNSGNSEVRTWAPYAAFSIPAGQAIDPSIKDTGWTAAFSGMVDIEEPGKYRFFVETEGGKATLSVSDANAAELAKGKALKPGSLETDWITLPAAKIQLTVRFTQDTSSPKGSRLRTRWEMDRSSLGTGFYPEPIPTSLVSAPKFGASFAAVGYTAQKGRVRLGKFGCLNCHDATDAVNQAVTTRTAPLLGEIGRRADPHWLERWILDPQAIRPDTLMPDVLGDSDKDKAEAEAIVHFLVAPHYDAASWTQPVATEPEVLAKGRELYHTIGCVQCHGALESPQAVFGEQGQPATVPSPKVPLPHGKIAGKWQPAELAAFLKDPQKIRPSGAMPSLLLKDDEADLLATYLITMWKDGDKAPTHEPFTVDPAKVEIGRAAFAARGCADCHSMGGNLPDVASTLKAPPLAALTGAASSRGCLDPADTRTPRYKLSDTISGQIKAAIEPALKATGLRAPVDHMIRTVDGLDCRACHTIEGQGGVQSSLRPYLRTLIEIDLGDEARLPPHLNLAGWKLVTPWLREVFTEGGRARRYMATRMPQFGEINIGRLPEEFAHVAGVWPNEANAEPKTTEDMALVGRQLVGDSGLNCITCHAVANYPPAGAAGPNVAEFAGRLRYEWWHTYALGPARQKPGTRMPGFFATGKSTKTDILDGDPQKQIDALWAYFNLAGMAPPPSGVQTNKGLSLSVGDKPRIFRTFMNDAGSRGIAVGFPVGTHFGFDATAVRLVDAWKGDFIDATGAWANRGGNPATGQGKMFWTAPAGPAIVISSAAPQAWPSQASQDPQPRFQGYRLATDGVPTFLYQVGTATVEETFTPAQGGLRRTFTLSGVPTGSKVYFNAGPGVAEHAGDQPADAKAPVLEFTPVEGKVSFSVVIKP